MSEQNKDIIMGTAEVTYGNFLKNKPMIKVDGDTNLGVEHPDSNGVNVDYSEGSIYFKPTEIRPMGEEFKFDTRRYDWHPEKDITAYELAKCMPVVNCMQLTGNSLVFNTKNMVDELPENCQRHFEIVE